MIARVATRNGPKIKARRDFAQLAEFPDSVTKLQLLATNQTQWARHLDLSSATTRDRVLEAP